MARDIQLAVSAASLVVKDAGLDTSSLDRESFGVNLGAGLISAELDELARAITTASTDGNFSFAKWGVEGMAQLFPLWLLKYLPNMLASHISINYDAQGPSNTHTAGDASSTHALGESFRIIERDDADVMISGGADSKIHPLSILRYHLFRQLASPKNPLSTSYHAFDALRDGFVVGEGAALLMLEELEHARARKAPVYAEIAGFGASSEAYHPHTLDPEGKGLEVALRSAIQDSGLSPGDIGCVYAHGLGEKVSAVAECRALRRVFEGVKDPLVTSVKPTIGHVSAASGAFATVSAALSLARGVVPPIANFGEPDAECSAEFVKGNPFSFDSRAILVSSFGYGGQCAALVLKRAEVSR